MQQPERSVALSTNGVRVTVEATYQPAYSDPYINKYIFSYSITIENRSPRTIQLLRRRWKIFDSNGMRREVEGEGVVGEQPVLAPGNVYQYSSWCNLLSDMGRMEGSYLFSIVEEPDVFFEAEIPMFEMAVPFKHN